jgi:fluoroacetyl-CoA thioesterase
MSHCAATPVGIHVTATVELVDRQGKRLRFKVVCRDPTGVISEGFHERVVVNFDKFIEQVNRKHGAAQ